MKARLMTWVQGQRAMLGAVSLALVAMAGVGLLVIRNSGGARSRGATVEAVAPDPSQGAASVAASPSPSPSPVPSPSPTPTKPPPPPDLNPHLGTQGPDVLALQQRLASLAYMVGTVDGHFGAGTYDGVIAFQKVQGLKRTGEADPATLAALKTATTPTAAYATPASHVELDIARQVVFVVRGGAVTQILATSTGSGQAFTSEGWTRKAITPNGAFQVYWKVPGWHKAPLGSLYKPSFFNNGIAFHGYNSVPTYPASHGCARLPMEFADWFYDNAAPMGSTVYVYGGPNGPNPTTQKETSASIDAPPPPETPAPSPSPPPLLGGLLGGPSPTPSRSPTPVPSTPVTPTP